MRLLFLCAVVLVGCNQSKPINPAWEAASDVERHSAIWPDAYDTNGDLLVSASTNLGLAAHYPEWAKGSIIHMAHLHSLTNPAYLASQKTNGTLNPYGEVELAVMDTNKLKLILEATLSTVLATNVTERWPTHMEMAPRPSNASPTDLVAYTQQVPDSNPTNKWIRTTVRRQTFVEFTVRGTPFKGLLKEEVVADSEVEYVLERIDKWKEKQ